MTEAKKEVVKVLNAQVNSICLTAEVADVGNIAGVIHAQIVGEIQRDIVSGTKVQEAKNQIRAPKDSK